MTDEATDAMRERLDFLNLTETDRGALRALAPVISAAIGPALEVFYKKVRATPQTSRFFTDPSHMDSAADRQKRHWDTILKGEFSATYRAAVGTIGSIHARIGLEPRWYIGGYALVLERLISAVIDSRVKTERKGLFGSQKDQGDSAALARDLGVLVRATLLDMDLAIAVYLENLEERRREAEAQQARALELMAQALDRLADGDLTVTVDAAVSQKSERLLASFNRAIDSLREVIAAVGESSGGVRSGSAEIAQSSEHFGRQTEQQAAAIEQTSAAVAELAAAIRATAANAAKAHETVGRIHKEAEQNSTVVRQAVAAIGEIEASSRKIAQIITVIDEIAFQTNLLALNAGVEAARAGESGRGFAVVAQEVRALAQRSAEAAREINALIATSSSQVKEGVRLVGATEEWLGDIGEAFRRISGIVEEMSGSAQSQAGGISEITSAITQIDQTMQRSAAMVEENAAASRTLAGEAEALSTLVGRFTLAEDAAPRAAAGRRRAA